MGGEIGEGGLEERRGVKISRSTGKNGFSFHISDSVSICSLRYLKVTSNYSYSREVGKWCYQDIDG